MSRRRKVIVALAAVAVIAVCAWWRWPRNVYRYQGKTVEEWFNEFSEQYAAAPDAGQLKSSIAFSEMGTNAAPFLASRITRNFDSSPVEILISKFRGQFHYNPKPGEALIAAALLGTWARPSDNVLRELLKPALLSTNSAQREAAKLALGNRP